MEKQVIQIISLAGVTPNPADNALKRYCFTIPNTLHYITCNPPEYLYNQVYDGNSTATEIAGM